MSGMNGRYTEFLRRKRQMGADHGFEPIYLPDVMFGFQKHLADWAIRKGRAAILADCGLGKTLIELAFADNVVRKTNKRVLIFTPLAVSDQTVREGEKFGIECHRSRTGELPKGSKIVVSNYEQMHRFDPACFSAVVGDESSRVKHFDSATKARLMEFSREIPYRMLATATAAPNDYFELGTSSEILGYLGFQDMLSRFFKQDDMKDYLVWGRQSYRFRGHAEEPFWRWVCSWARSCRKPSDLGFDDNGFILPPLNEVEHVVKHSRPHPGRFFSQVAKTRPEQLQEQRATMVPRCEKAAELVAEHAGASVVWCYLNDEADLLEKIIPDAVQVSGSLSEEEKERRLSAFQQGGIRILVTKPKIGAWGLNWQHCSNVITFPSHSWEQYYQSVRRCWRFGQENPVTVHIVSSEGEQRVIRSLKRKALQADRMFMRLVEHMQEVLDVDREIKFEKSVKIPSWIGG